ncbi:MAG: site-specific DNA-methyltransferase [Oscillospiraceae bacterium]|nr:site-specific DNA-methyltransferase [Oscillospiraceae bacterium]
MEDKAGVAKIKSKKQIEISKLKLYENNAKQHSEDQIRKIADSIREFGFLSPCLVDTAGNVIAGHGRIAAAELLGMKTVPCVTIEDLTEDQRRAYILADNRLTELGEWDMAIVSDELAALREHGFDIDLTGFDIDAIDEPDIDFSDIDEGGGLGWEEDPEEAEEPTARRGDLYRLGKHLLFCGDATRAEDVAKVLQGAEADLVITDPPYNVALGWHMRPSEAKQLHRRTDGLVIENDDMSEEEYTLFLDKAFTNIAVSLREGGVLLHLARRDDERPGEGSRPEHRPEGGADNHLG